MCSAKDTVNALRILANEYESSDEEEEKKPNEPKSPAPDNDNHGANKRRKLNEPAGTCTFKRSLQSSDHNTASKRLPPPNEIIGLFPESGSPTRDETSTDTDHQGRQRAFPHQRGNWATYVYVQYSRNVSFDELVENLLSTLIKSPLDIQPIDHLHISLSRTVVLRHHWIQPFVDSLKDRLRHISRFYVAFDQLEMYANEEDSRTFLSLKAGRGSEHLHRLITAVDTSLKEYNLPPFYLNPSFHMSIGWCLGNQIEALGTHLPELQEKLENYCLDELDGNHMTFVVDRITVKAGNKLFVVPLTV